MFGKFCFLASDPESAQFILNAKDDQVTKSLFQASNVLKSLSDGNIVGVAGDTYKRQRQVCQIRSSNFTNSPIRLPCQANTNIKVYSPAFNHAAYKSYFSTFSVTIDKCIDKIAAGTRYYINHNLKEINFDVYLALMENLAM